MSLAPPRAPAGSRGLGGAPEAAAVPGWARLEWPVVALAAVAALVAWLLVPTHPNYDAYYHLVWGRELLDGQAPTFEAYAAPTQHPLYLAVAALAGLAGPGADRLLVLGTMLGLVALCWGAWRLALAVFGPWPALLTTAFVASSFAFLLYAVRAYVDVPFLALVTWAAALEARRPGRVAPFVLLALAGLLRPEAWVLAGALWLWRLPRPRLAETALVAVAPLVWAAIDLLVTGDPLHSLTSTSDLAEDLGRERGLANAPWAFASFLADVARPPVALAGAAGAVVAVRLLGWRRVAVPLGLLGAGALTFLALGAAGLSLLPRYVTVPAIALAVFAGHGVAGFTTLPGGSRLRTAWRRGALVVAVLGVAFLVWKLPSFGTLGGELRFTRAVHDDLVAVLATPEVREGMRCGPLTLPNYRLVPDARFILDAPRSAVSARSAQRRDRGVALVIGGRRTIQRYGRAAGASPTTNTPDPGFVPAVRRGRFTAYVRCP